MAQSCNNHSGQPVPRFASLRFDEAIGRSGPSSDHTKLWIYKRVGLPVEIIAETPNWRQIRDPDGKKVWMHRRLLSKRRSLWTRTATQLFARYDSTSPVIADIQPKSILSLERCRQKWCRIEAQGYRGWVEIVHVWGVMTTDFISEPRLEGRDQPCYRSASNPVDPAAGR